MAEELKLFFNPGPGDIIRDAMEELGWQQSDLSDITGLTEKTINQIINNKQGITPETAVLLGKAFSTSAEMWLNLDAKYQLRKRQDSNLEKEHLTGLKATLRKYMPVTEIKKKGWFANDVSTEEGIKKECFRLFGVERIPEEEYNQGMKFAARQTKYDYQYSQWYCRTWYEYAKLHAKKFTKLKPYNKEKLATLSKKFYQYTAKENGEIEIIKKLKECGVAFFVQSHLSKTYLDGATFIVGENPVIVYTGRYDRVDNFWFVLAHEISHVLLHYDILSKPVLDNLDSDAKSQREKEADANANEMLRTDDVLCYGEKYGKYLTAARLNELSENVGISVPVALGILQHNKLIEWRQFAKYREKVVERIPAMCKVG